MGLHKVSDRVGSAGGAGAINTKGWEVRTRMDDEKVGTVDDILVEDSGEARFLDVDLGLFNKRVLVPVERATTDSTHEVVWVDGFDKEGIERIPEYDGDVAKLNADYREGLLQAYSASGVAGSRATTDHDMPDRVEDTLGASPGGDTRLGRVGELSDYEVADHHPDVRGWDVMASDNRKIGAVEELVADTVAMTVLYLDVELDRDFRLSDDESRVLVPMEHVRLVEEDKVVWLDAMASAQARDIPAHRGTFDPAYQARVARVFPATGTAPHGTPRIPNDPRS